MGKKIFYGYIVATGMLTACMSETLSVEDKELGTNPSVSLYRMVFNTLEGGLMDSRASIDEESLNTGQGSSFRWDAGDRVMVWTGSDVDSLTPCLFATVEGGVRAARFEYQGVQVGSRLYFGFSPYIEGIQYNQINITVPTDGSILQTEKNNSHHLGTYRPMYTSVVTRDFDSSELTGLSFRHLTGLLYFRILNEMGKNVNIESVSIRCTSGVFPKHAVLKFTPDRPETEVQFDIQKTNCSETATLSFGKNASGIIVANNEIIQAFLPILPVENLTDTRFTLVLKANGKEYVSLEIDGNDIKSFKRGYYYRFGMRLKDTKIDVDSVIADWEQGNEIIVPID